MILPNLCVLYRQSEWLVCLFLPWVCVCLSRSPGFWPLTRWFFWWPPHSCAPAPSSTVLFPWVPSASCRGERSAEDSATLSASIDPAVSSVWASGLGTTRTKTRSTSALFHPLAVVSGFWWAISEWDCLVPYFLAAALYSSRLKTKIENEIVDFSLRLPGQVNHQKKHLARSNSRIN